METRICGRCKQEKPVTEFYKSKRDGYRSRCKICSKLDFKEYVSRPEISKLQKAYRDEYYSKPEVKERVSAYAKERWQNPEFRVKHFARNHLRYMVRIGKIVKEPCAMCGIEQAEAHHPDYTIPLMIVWLCPECHRKFHKTLKEME